MARRLTLGAEPGHVGVFDLRQGGSIVDGNSTPTRVRTGRYAWTGDPDTGGLIATLPGGPFTEGYFGVAFRGRAFGAWAEQWPLVVMGGGSTLTTQMAVQITTDGKLRIGRGGLSVFETGAFTVLTEATDPLDQEQWYWLEVYCLIDNTNGIFQVRLGEDNGEAVGAGSDSRVPPNFAGDTQHLSYNTFSAVRCVHSGIDQDDLVFNDTTGSVNNSWPGNRRLYPILVNGAGDVNTFTPTGAATGYEAVDERPPDDATSYDTGNATGEKALYHFEDAPLGNSIAAIGLWPRVRRPSGSDVYRRLIKTGGVEYQGDKIVPAGSFAYEHESLEYKPSTTTLWRNTDIDAIQAGAYIDACTGDYEAEVLADSPAGYWRLGETSGTVAADSSGNGNDGTITALTLNQATPICEGNPSMRWPGSVAEYIEVPHDAALALTGDLSIEAWLYPESSGGRAIVSKTNSNQPASYDSYLNGLTPRFLRGNGLGANAVVDCDNALDLNVWTHLVITMSGTTVTFYFNGAQSGTTKTLSTTHGDQGNAFRIGRRIDSATLWHGYMDEVAIYGSALSAARVLAHYEAAQP